MTLKAQIYKDVVEELQLLDDARRALRDGDAVQAGRSLEAAREERLQRSMSAMRGGRGHRLAVADSPR